MEATITKNTGRWRVPQRGTRKTARLWCGPYAAAVVLGWDYGKTYDAIKARRDRRNGWKSSQPILGMHLTEIQNFILEDTRKRAGRMSVYGNPTLTQWYKDRPDKTATYIVELTSHFVVIRGTRIIDNQIGEWRTFAKSKHLRRARVQAALKII